MIILEANDFLHNNIYINKHIGENWGLGIGDWGFGDWGLGIGDWGSIRISNSQFPIPNPQSPFFYFFK